MSDLNSRELGSGEKDCLLHQLFSNNAGENTPESACNAAEVSHGGAQRPWVTPSLERLSLKAALTAKVKPGDDGPGYGS